MATLPADAATIVKKAALRSGATVCGIAAASMKDRNGVSPLAVPGGTYSA